jgi:hypothetical protein
LGKFSFSNTEKVPLQSWEHFSKMEEEESSLGNTKKFPISAMGFSRIRKKRFQRIQDF